MNIIATLQARHQICDYMLVASKTCMRLFTIHVTSELYLAGDKIVRYCLNTGSSHVETKTYELETNCQMYGRIYATTGSNRDRVFLAVPLLTKKIHEITTKRGDPLAKVTNLLDTKHKMRKIILHIDKYHAITYAYDGLVIVRNLAFDKTIATIMPHYRLDGGVLKAYIDPLSKYIISLGRDNTLACTSLTSVNINAARKRELQEIFTTSNFAVLFARPTIGFAPTGELEGMTWYEVQALHHKESERKKCEAERQAILEEFHEIQAEVQELLTKNIEGPENEILDLQEFNIDWVLKEHKMRISKEECRITQIKLQELIVAQDKVSEWLKKYCWEPMKVHGRLIYGLYSKASVDNYKILNEAAEDMKPIKECLRRLEKQLADGDTFQPWVPKSDSELKEHLAKVPDIRNEDPGQTILNLLDEDESQAQENIPDAETITAFMGTTTSTFVEINPAHYEQIELQSFFQQELETTFCQDDMLKVQLYFNKIFEDMFSQKERDVALVKERNARLRTIISEINYFSTNKLSITIDDPEWNPEEYPDSVLQVTNKEIGVTPYISPSEQAILDAIAAEEERIRLLLLADDFREKALIVMMNGVLEIRWEDELKKEVPKPKCMLEKQPGEYNEEDLRAVRDYEEAVKFLNSERERYKKLLEAEYARVAYYVREIVRKFNVKLADLFLMELQVESAVTQEILKIARIRLTNFKRTRTKEIEYGLHASTVQTHKEIESLNKTISSVQQTLQELKSRIDGFMAKEKALDKAFRKEFLDASPVVQEQTVKFYRRRPKAAMRNVTSVVLMLETAKCVVSHQRTYILTHDCLEYLKSLDVLDQYVNIPPAVDETAYAIVCKHRRLRIENETKMKALHMEIAEAETTLSTFNKWLNQKKEHLQKLSSDLDHLRHSKLHFAHDIELQLVLPNGLVEIPTTGTISDFKDAVLISRTDVELINKIILKGGSKKIKAMEETMNFRRGIVQMEWEHKQRRMIIEDIKDFIADIENTKVTKDVQVYIEHKFKGQTDKNLSFEEEVELLRIMYKRDIEGYKAQTKEYIKNINAIKKDNQRLDEQIANINIEVCEFQLDRDVEMEKREQDIYKLRMATLLKRANLIKQIQKNHSEILMLQTELELWRLKTYPTLSYTVLT